MNSSENGSKSTDSNEGERLSSIGHALRKQRRLLVAQSISTAHAIITLDPKIQTLDLMIRQNLPPRTQLNARFVRFCPLNLAEILADHQILTSEVQRLACSVEMLLATNELVESNPIQIWKTWA